MSTEITCPTCGAQGKVFNRVMGKTVRCQHCQTSFEIQPKSEPNSTLAEPGCSVSSKLGNRADSKPRFQMGPPEPLELRKETINDPTPNYMGVIRRAFADFALKPAYFVSLENIPTKKLKNATASFAPLQTGEVAVALIDSTVFGSAKKGLLLTDRRCYHSNGWTKGSFIYSDINECKCASDGDTFNLILTIDLKDKNQLNFRIPSRAAKAFETLVKLQKDPGYSDTLDRKASSLSQPQERTDKEANSLTGEDRGLNNKEEFKIEPKMAFIYLIIGFLGGLPAVYPFKEEPILSRSIGVAVVAFCFLGILSVFIRGGEYTKTFVAFFACIGGTVGTILGVFLSLQFAKDWWTLLTGPVVATVAGVFFLMPIGWLVGMVVDFFHRSPSSESEETGT